MYFQNKTLSRVTTKPTNYQLWKSLMTVNEDFFRLMSLHVGNRENTRFREDTLLGESLLARDGNKYNLGLGG
jgi:hypothetical protein